MSIKVVNTKPSDWYEFEQKGYNQIDRFYSSYQEAVKAARDLGSNKDVLIVRLHVRKGDIKDAKTDAAWGEWFNNYSSSNKEEYFKIYYK